MNLFNSNIEMLVFILLAIPFAGVVITTILILYSDHFVQANTVLVSKMFTGKSKKLGRVIVIAILAISAHLNHWLMLETLFIGYIGYHLTMLAFFRNKVRFNFSLNKY